MVTPQKNIHKIFIPPKIFIVLKTPKNIEIQIFEPKKISRLRMYKNVRVPPWDDIKLLRKSEKYFFPKPWQDTDSRADDWQKVLSLRTLLVRSVQHLVTYTKMFVCMSSFRIRLMTSSLMSTNRVTALEPYIPIITDYQNFACSWQIALHLFLISIHN